MAFHHHMSARKIELRKIVLDIVFKRESVTYGPSQLNNLNLGVAEVLNRGARAGGSYASVFQPESRLDAGDAMLVMEIFWDLVVEKILTIGLNSDNPNFPWFRLHSEAKNKSV